MNNFEFLSYKPYPNDQYLQGIATIRYMKALILRLKLVKTREGNGSFFCFQNYTVTENGEKKYVPCCMMDSRAEEEMLQDWLRTEIHKATRVTTAHVSKAPEAPFVQAMPVVDENDPIPF